MKSANWISAIGRSPASARPMPMPMIDDSASGVSSTRSAPNAAASPSVARNTPPRGPTSSPSTTTRSSAARRSCWVWRTVSTMFRSVVRPVSAGSAARATGWSPCAVGHAPERPERAGEDLRVGVGGLGEGLGLGPLGGLVDLRLHLGLEAVLVGLRQQALLDEVLLHLPQRVLLPPGLDLLARAVGAVVVVGRVGHEAVRLALDERRPLTPPGPADRGVGGAVHVERVVAVDDHARRSRSCGRGRRRRRPRTPS